MTFLNCLKLIEVQSGDTSAFRRLTSYLHYLLRHSSQGLFNPSSQISTCLAGNEIPGWFNYQSVGSSLKLQLPPFWWTNNCLTCLDMWEACNHLKVTFSSDQLRVKYSGFRAIFSRDIDELVLCSRPFQNLGLPNIVNVDRGKRNHDDFCSGSGVEPGESRNLVNKLSYKRMRMTEDPES
ncbi:conserved hypothetical protein [Ricinus communis]|uniref:C-JID domain-containing protein n=1 Tax=Ricinus communis TaxID=3988 RepID=B9RM37_RICCO|nr:conserved hypothetical protein [Ricinus communis]